MNLSLYINRFLTAFADFGLMFLIPLYVFQTTGSAELSALVFSVEYLAKVLFGPIAGLISDRYSLVRLIAVANGSRAIMTFLAGLVLIEWPGLWPILVVALINGFGFTLNFMVQETLLTEVAPGRQFARVQARVQSLEQVALVSAPLVLAACLPWISYVGALWLTASVLLIALILLWRGCRQQSFQPPPDRWLSLPDLLRTNLRVGHAYLVRSRPLQKVVLSTLLVNLIYGTLLAIGAPAVIGLFAKTEQSFASLQSLGAVASVIVLTVIAKWSDRLSPTRWGLMAFVAMGLGGLVAGLAPSYSVFVVGALLVLGFDGSFSFYIRTRRAEIIPRQDYGKAMGLLMVVNNLSKPLSGLFVLALLPWLSVLQVLLLMSGVAIVLTVSLRLFATEMNAQPGTPA